MCSFLRCSTLFDKENLGYATDLFFRLKRNVEIQASIGVQGQVFQEVSCMFLLKDPPFMPVAIRLSLDAKFPLTEIAC